MSWQLEVKWRNKLYNLGCHVLQCKIYEYGQLSCCCSEVENEDNSLADLAAWCFLITAKRAVSMECTPLKPDGFLSWRFLVKSETQLKLYSTLIFIRMSGKKWYQLVVTDVWGTLCGLFSVVYYPCCLKCSWYVTRWYGVVYFKREEGREMVWSIFCLFSHEKEVPVSSAFR